MHKTIHQKKTCIPIFIAALFTIAKHGNNVMSTDRRMVVVHGDNVILLSHKKRKKNASCRNMDGPGDYHTKLSKSERERQISYDITYM